jgi:UDPglucose 6-dehydrogenase
LIGVVGLGFVGLTTALGLAAKGHLVVGFELNPEKRQALKSGRVPFHEPHLEEELNRLQGERVTFVDDTKSLVSNSRIIFLCVGTPTGDDGEADLSPLKTAIANCLEHVDKNSPVTFVVKSTVPPSTTAEVILPFIEDLGFKVGEDVGLTNNPEFLREGLAWEDFTRPDRIVIGQVDDHNGTLIEELYAEFDAPVFRVSLTTAEFVKYLSNSLLATLISFSNEMAMAANLIGDVNVPQAFDLLHMDRRWHGSPARMTSYVYPGCGFGGYCLPKDILAMASMAQRKGANSQLLRAAIDVNQLVKQHFVERILAAVSARSTVGILGLTFKPMSDDVREAPAKDIIEGLIAADCTQIEAYDPLGIKNFRAAYNLPIKYAESTAAIVERCDPIVITTAWPEFSVLRSIRSNKTIIDGRYFL